MFVRAAAGLATRTFHAFSFFLLVVFATVLTGYTLLSLFGMAPWLSAELRFGDVQTVEAGIYIQLALTAIFLALMFFVPSSTRLMELEKSHRTFRLSMEDVAKAYHQCHTADRAGLFTMSSEFDAVRERIQYLNEHPDLASLEGDVLTVAAQMSEKARHLADVYSDEHVARAKTFLRERQEEAERQQRQIVEALHICRQIRDWSKQVNAEEASVNKQLAQLDKELQAVLPQLGYGFEEEDAEPETNVVQLPHQKPAAE